MVRKNYISVLAAIAVVFLGCWSAAAQTTVIGGKIVVKKADGSTVPVPNALVEAYRIDVKSALPSDKSDKKGFFNFVGVQYGSRYVLSISGPGLAPGYLPGVKAGEDKILVTLSEGDGKRWTEEEVRGFLTAPADSGSNAAAQAAADSQNAENKKKQEEYDKKFKENEDKKKKGENTFAVVQKDLEEGRKAAKESNYDLAITKFDEGFQADPDFVGSAPVLLNEKAGSLTLRAVVSNNANAKVADASARVQGKQRVKKDFTDALDTYANAWKILTTAPETEIQDKQAHERRKLQTLTGIGDTLRYMVKTETGDASKIDAIKPILVEYFAVEKDAAKKAEVQTYIADIYRLAGEPEKAVAEYRKALEMSPDSPDALAGIGLSLFYAGENAGNNEQKQEGLNFMQRFADTAPANHPLKDDVAQVVTYLKSQNLKPQKTSGGGKKKN